MSSNSIFIENSNLKLLFKDCHHNRAQNVFRQYRSSFFQQFAAQVEAKQPLQFLVWATYSLFSRLSHILLIFSSEPHTPYFLVRHTSKFSSFPLIHLFIVFCRTFFTKHIIFFTYLKFGWENLMYCFSTNMTRFSTNIFICKAWTFKKDISGRTRILRWLGRENEENVARTINCYG